MKNKIIYVSGLLNFETILNVDSFPVNYFPIEYPFYGINTGVGGTAYNISKALTKLGDKVILSSHVGDDLIGKTIVSELKKAKINDTSIYHSLDQTPTTVVLTDRSNNTQMYCDLKSVQDVESNFDKEKEKMEMSDLIILCNSNFNRPLLKEAKKLNKKIATDVHIIGSIDDVYNSEFMESSDILFLSSKGIYELNYENFLIDIYNNYHNEIIVLGEGRDGAMILDSKKRIIYHIDAVTIRDIVNTVGSRDALFSAFLHFYIKGYDSLEALELAEVFTSYKLGESGGSNGFLNEKEIIRIKKNIDFDVYKIREF